MENSFKIKIITPDRTFFDDEIESLVINTDTGEMGVLKGMLPTVATVRSGIVRLQKNDRWMEAVNSDGVITVMRNGVTVLVESCEWPHEIDGEKIDARIDELTQKEKKAKSVYESKMLKAQLAAQFAKLKIKSKDD